ncbi:MAG: hypothetical protein ACP5TY_01605 [Thermodesulforhabdaceae bacterium]
MFRIAQCKKGGVTAENCIYIDIKICSPVTCPSCKTEYDRGVNAALNIQRLSLATVSCTGSYACGDDSSMKQESDHVIFEHDLSNGSLFLLS